MGYVETARLDSLLKASPSNFLGVVRHDRSSGEPSGLGACPVVCLDMPQFNGPPLAEVWTSTLSVTYHQAEGIHCAMNDEVLFGALQLEERPGTLLDILTYTAYRRLLVQARALGYPHLLRVWNYFPTSTVNPTGWNGTSAFAPADTRPWPRTFRTSLEPCLRGQPLGRCPAR